MGEIQQQIHGSVAWLTIANSARHNAMSHSMWRQLAQRVQTLEADRQVRVLVLCGEGQRAFVSGADISEFGERANSAEASAGFNRAVDAAEAALAGCSKPVIAMIRGICMGGGIGIAVSCDLRYCSENSVFRMPAARLGVGYALDSMRRIVDVLGSARTAELFFTARKFDGTEAQRTGLVHSAVPEASLHDTVEQVAQMIAANAPLSMQAAKLAIAAIAASDDPAACELAHRAVQTCADSTDFIEGREAFMQKRVARFTGN